MYKRLFAIIAMLTILAAAAAAAQGDIRIKKQSRTKMAGMPEVSEEQIAQLPEASRERFRNMMKRESTVYIKGSRMRTDMTYEKASGFKAKKVTHSIINQCDQKRMIAFDDDKPKYTVTSYGSSGTPASAASAAPVKSKKPAAARGTVRISINAVDTGERMKLFGYNARRIKQTITMTPSGSSCMKSPLSMQVDGWYADLPTFSCALRPNSGERQDTTGECNDEIVYESKGLAATGVPLKEVRTITTDGNTVTLEEEVIEMTSTSLSASLFVPPAGYTPDDGIAIGLEADTTASSVTVETSAPALAPPSAGMEKPAIESKKAGVIRIGIANPATDMGKGFESTDSGGAVRNTLAVALKADNTEIVMLDSTLPEQEAKQKGCDYVFHSKVTRKKGGGGMFGSMGPMLAGAAAGMIPGVGGIIASVATSGVITATTIAGGFKSKDEVGFEYRLTSTDGTALIAPTTSKLKAKKDGDDVLTPQIQTAATAVLGQVSKSQ